MATDRDAVVTQTWEQVLATVEADVHRTEALLHEPLHVSDAVLAYLAPAATQLPVVEPMVPPLSAMPPVPPELAERIRDLRARVVALQSQLREEMAALRAATVRAAGSAPVLSVVAPSPAHYFDSLL
ncbi:hypothetical protein SAMN05443575_1868 [Jatrophihabitans endophyticus]|uniref:Uncharacterized protein n=1 Tax=Jatrophihabitans endophyticus TaxID=1206085 RepID=A0A1M5IG46_9ACTN|nr:hypothetical protein [Jatrophihabitans endophyticus]SHG26753.1 hypothetical protein SAMN05443575_1868 [Jatrophihabitans endophyticus]